MRLKWTYTMEMIEEIKEGNGREWYAKGHEKWKWTLKGAMIEDEWMKQETGIWDVTNVTWQRKRRSGKSKRDMMRHETWNMQQRNERLTRNLQMTAGSGWIRTTITRSLLSGELPLFYRAILMCVIIIPSLKFDKLNSDDHVWKLWLCSSSIHCYRQFRDDDFKREACRLRWWRWLSIEKWSKTLSCI
jgi:hypothetical protein